jgi:hypothetical protein
MCNIDGGLLVLSRFPIVEKEFRPFRYGVLSDDLSYKGVLYAKIVIAERVLHLFNTHTQATYFEDDVRNFKDTIETRQVQMKLLRHFLEEKTRDAKDNESIIICGDMNVNGALVDKKSTKYSDLIAKVPDYNLALDDFAREYEVMMDVLSNNDEDRVVDVLREAH